MKAYVFIILLLMLFVTSCWHRAPSYLNRNFTYKYVPNNDTRFDTLININGVYENKYTYKKGLGEEDVSTVIWHTIFFKDGSFVKTVNLNDVTLIDGAINLYDYIDRVIKNDSLEKFKYLYNDYYWGNYILSDDTIKVQYVQRAIWGSTDGSWDAYEAWFKVLNRNSFIQIFEKRLDEPYKSEIEYYENKLKKRTYLPSKFIPIKKMPKPKGWVKEEKWFWANKEEYKKYMEQIKK